MNIISVYVGHKPVKISSKNIVEERRQIYNEQMKKPNVFQGNQGA